MWIETVIVGNASKEIINKKCLINLNAIDSIMESEEGRIFVQVGTSAVQILYPYDAIKTAIGKKDLYGSGA